MFEEQKEKMQSAKTIASLFWHNRSGSALANKIIELSIAVLVFAIIGVISIGYIVAANTTGWDTNTKTMFLLIPVFLCLAVVLMLIYSVLSRRGR